MTTSKATAKDQDKAPESPDAGHQAELGDASESPAPTESAAPKSKSPEDLSPNERVLLSRHYRSLRLAQSEGDAETAREQIRELLGPDAEIGDHVVTLANGEQHRAEFAGSTRHNGIPILSVYEDAL